jgi:hypothetical protein
MCDCNYLIEAIQKGGPDLEREILKIVRGEDPCKLKNVAFFVYQKYCFRNNIYTFEDLFYEGIRRFIKKIEAGLQLQNPSCKPLLFEICKNICYEWNRLIGKSPTPDPEVDLKNELGKPKKPKKETNIFNIEDLVILMETSEELKEAVEKCMEGLGKKCNLLLTLRFFEIPKVEDHQLLAEALNTLGYRVKAEFIYAEIDTCRIRLRNCLRERLKDYYDDFNN